ncbi:MAG: T9SS type A sorting domain-containing protein, partial [Bacteroidota bacterium]|nr:T9SS type A sorting domain-containing protein [Bacteroidota bacterium]
FGLSGDAYIVNPEFADLDQDGDLDIMAGGFDGALTYFRNSGSSISPAFDPPQINPFLLEPADLTLPALADLDHDGDVDIMATDYEGNYLFFENVTIIAVSPFPAEEEFSVLIYPNPNFGQFNIDAGLSAQQIEITDAVGRKIYMKQFNQGQDAVNIELNEAGIYTVRIFSGDRQVVRQMVINK